MSIVLQHCNRSIRSEMDQELIEYKDIFNKLKPLVNTVEFDTIFKKLTQDIPPGKRFLIKMELKRLAKPCTRNIDLRGLVDGECRLFEHEGRKHYLDPVGEAEFHAKLKIYGLYCFGVYEAVMETENNFKVMRRVSEQQAKEEENASLQNADSALLRPFDIPLIELLNYANRSHERMNFAVAIEIQDESENSFHVTSIDISQVALRLKIPNGLKFQPQQRLMIFFRGLEDEFAMDKQNGIAYSVITSRVENDTHYLILHRENSLSSPSFDKFLEQFIHGNKRRYKVNLANTTEAINNKSAEQYISSDTPTLPVFIDETQQSLIPRYILVNGINRGVLDYWQDENHDLKISYLLTASRLSQLKITLSESKPLFVYSFIHFNAGAIQYYSASDTELARDSQLKSLFLGFGARKVSWRVFKLSMTEINLSQANIVSSIPGSFNDKVKGLNIAPSARLQSHLKQLRYTVHITDVTSQSAQEHYATHVIDRSRLAELKVFSGKGNQPLHPVNVYPYRLYEHKKKTAYLLRAPSKLVAESEDELAKGLINEVSVDHITMELTSTYGGNVGDRVRLMCPKSVSLQGTTESAALIFEIKAINAEQKLLNLSPPEGVLGETARQFADKVIERQAHSLDSYITEEDVPGITLTLRCINARNNPNFAFLLSAQGVRLVPSQAILSDSDIQLNQLVCHNGENNCANIEFLFRDSSGDSILQSCTLNSIKSVALPMRELVMLSYDSTAKQGKKAIIARLANSFNDAQSCQRFIEEAMYRGEFMAVEIYLTPTTKPDMTLISAELKYVSLYALHKAKAIEEQIWSIAATAHVVDVTGEVLLRFGYKNKSVQPVSTAV